VCSVWISCVGIALPALHVLGFCICPFTSVSPRWGGLHEMSSLFLESCSCSFLTQKPLASQSGVQRFPQRAIVMSRAGEADEPWWNNDPVLMQMCPPERLRWKRPIRSPCPLQAEQCKISPGTVLVLSCLVQTVSVYWISVFPTCLYNAANRGRIIFLGFFSLGPTISEELKGWTFYRCPLNFPSSAVS